MPLPVSVLVALDAKSDEILSRIIAQSAALLNVMKLEDPRCTRTIGNASRLALRLHGRAGDKLQGQALIVVVLARIPVKASPARLQAIASSQASED